MALTTLAKGATAASLALDAKLKGKIIAIPSSIQRPLDVGTLLSNISGSTPVPPIIGNEPALSVQWRNAFVAAPNDDFSTMNLRNRLSGSLARAMSFAGKKSRRSIFRIVFPDGTGSLTDCELCVEEVSDFNGKPQPDKAEPKIKGFVKIEQTPLNSATNDPQFRKVFFSKDCEGHKFMLYVRYHNAQNKWAILDECGVVRMDFDKNDP